MGVSQVIYHVLKTQIQFGVYRFGDTLPTMENASDNFFVALATVRAAYLRLQQEGYIKLSPNVGSVVIKNYSEQETEACIQQFFSQRRHALIDLSKSIRPLLGHMQWVGLKNAPVEIFQDMMMFQDNDISQPYFAFNHIMRAYGTLGNELLLQLLWQIYMFFEAPFFSIPENSCRMFALREYAPLTLNYSLRQDWEPLKKVIYDSQDFFSLSLCQFYEHRITAPQAEPEIAFSWNPYKKASQICYSLAMDLLVSICRGQYAANTLLPSLNQMAKEKHVSVSTIRRTLSLLNGVGAVKSVKRIGTWVLPLDAMTENCDFTKPVVRKRLYVLAQSLQLLTLSCRATAEVTISSLNSADLQLCREHFLKLQERRQYELSAFAALELIKQFAPYQAIRTVYTELLQQLFWGYSLRSLRQPDQDRRALYMTYHEAFIKSLEAADAACFAEKLEELMKLDFHGTIKNLTQSGIQEAERLLIDDLAVSGQM